MRIGIGRIAPQQLISICQRLIWESAAPHQVDGRVSQGRQNLARRRHRTAEEKRARRQQHAGDIAPCERADAGGARRLEVVDRARAELERERDRAALRELVAVQPQRKACVAARLEIAARLGGVERAAFEEDVGGRRDLRGFGQHLREREVEVGVAVVELRRHRVRAEPRRRAARVADRAQGRELGVVVEPVAGLALPRRRAVREHPLRMPLDSDAQSVGVQRARRPDGREDAAACRVQLLVARAARAQGELLDAVAAERGMRVAVDEPRQRAETAAVELLDVAVE